MTHNSAEHGLPAESSRDLLEPLLHLELLVSGLPLAEEFLEDDQPAEPISPGLNMGYLSIELTKTPDSEHFPIFEESYCQSEIVLGLRFNQFSCLHLSELLKIQKAREGFLEEGSLVYFKTSREFQSI